MEFICNGIVLIYLLSLVAQAIGGVASWLAERRQRSIDPESVPAALPRREPHRTTALPTRSLSALARRTSTYRPTLFGAPSKVKFRKLPSTFSSMQLSGLVDALSGAPLDPAGGLYRCPHCQVFYNSHSVAVIRRESGGRCVSCLRPRLVTIRVAAAGWQAQSSEDGTAGPAPRFGHRSDPSRISRTSLGREPQQGSSQTNLPPGRNALPGVVTLANYRQFVGRAVTFEGHVPTVLVSKRGLDYAVMFENRSWVGGLKAMVFRRDVERVGGRQFVLGLANKRLRVRGLLANDPTFGYQIVVSERRMIKVIDEPEF